MNPQEKMKEIKDRLDAFKHWININSIRNANPELYNDSSGPDMEWLIARVEQLEASLGSIEWTTKYEDGSKDSCRAHRKLIEDAISAGPKPDET